jgi:hypothetical protein
LENFIFKHPHNYLLRYNILSDDQSGFRHRDSTINQLLVIYDVIMKNLDIGKDVRILTSCFLVNSIGLVFEALKLTHQSDAQVLRLFKSEFRDSAVSFLQT